MDDVIFSELLNNSDIKVSISMFKGKYRVDIRKFWDDKGEMKPSPKGINMSIDEFKLLCELIPSLQNKILELNIK